MACEYPPIEPFNHGWLDVGDGHEIYFEQVGNPEGVPIVFTHGGPGDSCKKWYKNLFNPSKFNAILFDQRGCGRSRCDNPLIFNTTDMLISDIELLRQHLGVDKWHIMGSSWGSSLMLAYAQAHGDKVLSMLIGSTWFTDDIDNKWFSQEGYGQSAVFPEYYADFVSGLSPDEISNIFHHYANLIVNGSESESYEAACKLSKWHYSGMNHIPEVWTEPRTDVEKDSFMASERIFAHYVLNDFFFKPRQLRSNLHKLPKVPTNIIHGRYDMCCPLVNSWELHKALPHSKLHIVEAASHRSSVSPELKAKYIEILDNL